MLTDATCLLLFYNFSLTFQVSLHPFWQGSTRHYHWTIYCSVYINIIFVYFNLLILSIKSIANYKTWLKLIRYHNESNQLIPINFWYESIALISNDYDFHQVSIISIIYALCSAEYWTFCFYDFRISNFHQAMFNFPKLAKKLCHCDCVAGHFQHTVL